MVTRARKPPPRRLALEGELTINLNISGGGTPADNDALNQILALLGQSATREQAMSQELDDLAASVAAQTDIVSGVGLVVQQSVEVMDTIAQQLADAIAALEAAGADPAALVALRDQVAENSANLAASKEALSAAVAENVEINPLQ